MTEAQIEAAARKLCELRGKDPDAEVLHGSEPDEHGIVAGMLERSPAWKLAAREVRAAIQMRSALEHAEPSKRWSCISF